MPKVVLPLFFDCSKTCGKSEPVCWTGGDIWYFRAHCSIKLLNHLAMVLLETGSCFPTQDNNNSRDLESSAGLQYLSHKPLGVTIDYCLPGGSSHPH